MKDSFKVLKKHYPNWTGEPELEYHKGNGNLPDIWQLSSENFEAKVTAAISHNAIQKKKTVLILVPKKEFFPLLVKELTRKQVPHNCSINLLPDRVNTAKRFTDWVQNPNDSFLTRLVIEDLINSKGIAAVPGAKKDGRSGKSTIEKRIGEETNIAKLWEDVDKNNDLYSIIQDYDNGNKKLKTIRDALINFEQSYNDFKKDKKGEFAKQLAFITGIWIDPSKMAEDITDVVKLIQAEQPFGSTSAQLMTMRKAKGLEAQVVIIVGLEDDIIPNPRSKNIEEEARLLYVSMTRAKEKLYLFHSFRRLRNISYGTEISDKDKSRFLYSLGRESKYKKPRKS